MSLWVTPTGDVDGELSAAETKVDYVTVGEARVISYTYDALYPVERGELPPHRGRLFQRRDIPIRLRRGGQPHYLYRHHDTDARDH